MGWNQWKSLSSFIALRALFITAQTFPGKSFFWADVVFCHGAYALKEMLLLLAWALQNSQQAISVTDLLVARQEILVMLAKSQFPFWAWFAVFVSIFLNSNLLFSVLPSQIMWVDVKKHWSSEYRHFRPFKYYPNFWCLPAVASLNCHSGDGLWSLGRCW